MTLQNTATRRPSLTCTTHWWRLINAGWVLWLLLMQGSAHAQDHIVERAWMEDQSRQMTWLEVQKQPFQTFKGVISRGFGQSVIWLRLRIDPHANPSPRRDPDRLVVRIRPVYLDDIRVFDPLAPQGLAGITGDQHHPRTDELQGLDFLVPIDRGTAPRDIWLRVESTSTRQIAVQVLNAKDLNELTQHQQILFAIYIGLILCLALWGFVHWLFIREQVIGAFAVHQLTALLFALCGLGYSRALWPLTWPAWALDQATSVFSMIAVSGAFLFHILLISEFKPSAWIQRTFWLMPIILAIKITLLLRGWPIVALRLNMIEVLVGPILFLAAVWWAQGWSANEPSQRPALARPVVIGLYVLLVIVLLLAALPGLGLTGGGEIPLYVVQIHGLVTAFLVLMLLQYRAHVMSKQQRTTALALERSLLQTQQERMIREEQEKLLAMLAHELKTPLATMHMRLDVNSSGSREIRQAIRDMNGVIDRCVQMTQLGDQQLVARPETCNLADLVRDAVSSCAQPTRVHMDMPSQLTVQTDRQLMFIVLNNLLENACKYAPQETPIHVRLWHETDKQTIGLEVRNQPDSAGWPDGARVFDKYYRSPHARRQAGTGLGLYLVRNLVQTLGGQIRYAPDNTWVRFVIELPAIA
jgi:signal transduction histidine kinase